MIISASGIMPKKLYKLTGRELGTFEIIKPVKGSLYKKKCQFCNKFYLSRDFTSHKCKPKRKQLLSYIS